MLSLCRKLITLRNKSVIFLLDNYATFELANAYIFGIFAGVKNGGC